MNRDNAFHQIRARLGGNPCEDGAVAVRDQHRRSDPIQKQCAARAPDVLSDGVISHGLTHGRGQLHDDGIVGTAAYARRGLFEGRRSRVEVAMHKRLIGTAALPRPVDDVNLITLFQQKRGPSPAPIGRADPVRALPVPAVDQDHGIRMPHGGRNPVLDIHLHAVAYRAAGEQRVLHPVPQITPLRDIQNRTRSVRGRLRAGIAWQHGQSTCRKDAEFAACEPEGNIARRHARILLRFWLRFPLRGSAFSDGRRGRIAGMRACCGALRRFVRSPPILIADLIDSIGFPAVREISHIPLDPTDLAAFSAATRRSSKPDPLKP